MTAMRLSKAQLRALTAIADHDQRKRIAPSTLKFLAARKLVVYVPTGAGLAVLSAHK